ncbi:hypothetical protein [Alcanivorax sp. 1008]|uniref:hypothetical protein n=1 Tax=Alcanivorax sp. 1008 TaxID=2816853 RepID=UPI001DCFFC7F|nr:hypothetical protein [Alcanivorax sp. 1008]MCC1496847.1 hypothetical protein [Alcanivorax sp. 1008]
MRTNKVQILALAILILVGPTAAADEPAEDQVEQVEDVTQQDDGSDNPAEAQEPATKVDPPSPPQIKRLEAREFTPIDLVCALGRVYMASSGSPVAPVWDAGGLPLKCADMPADMRYLNDRGISTSASIIAEMPSQTGKTYAACVLGRVYFAPTKKLATMATAWDLQGRPLRCTDWDGLIEHLDRFSEEHQQ